MLYSLTKQILSLWWSQEYVIDMYMPLIRYDLLQFNKDLEGAVQFSAEAGVFSVPIRCTIKKCDVSKHLNFCSSYHQYIFPNPDVLFLLLY